MALSSPGANQVGSWLGKRDPGAKLSGNAAQRQLFEKVRVHGELFNQEPGLDEKGGRESRLA